MSKFRKLGLGLIFTALVGAGAAGRQQEGARRGEPSFQAAEVVYKAKDVDRKVVILSKPEAEYTAEARGAGVAGAVQLGVTLRADGEVGEVHVLGGLPHGLTEQAVRAARTIKFEPAEKHGRHVSQHVGVEYIFAP